MNSSSRPQPNWPYLSVCVAIAALGLGWIAAALTLQVYHEWRTATPISGGWSWPAVVFVDAACVGVFGALLVRLWGDLHVAITPEEIVRIGAFGTRRIRWADVQRIHWVHYGLHIETESAKIVLAPYAYKNPAQLEQLVYEHARRPGLVE